MSTDRYISEWKPISELIPVKEDISEYGYSKEYIEKNKLDTEKTFCCSSGITGRVNFFEPLEVMKDGENVLFRENDGYNSETPEQFETQYGVFANHNNGEFISWLEKSGNNNNEKTGNFYIDGNYCDMFDCGIYSYAISNLMHMGLGAFKIVKISSDLRNEVLYDTAFLKERICLQYLGRFKNDRGVVLAASGFKAADNENNEERVFRKKTILFQIGNDGGFGIIKEWNVKITSSNGMVEKDNFLYLGGNKMITRIDLSSGEVLYYTNKNAEELNELKPIW